MVDTSDRKVRPISELGKAVDFGSLQMTDPIINKDGDVPATVEHMKKIVREHHKDVANIADRLYDPKLSRFLQNIFNFVMTYVKYEKDSAFKEQLRTPLRTLHDQRGDCDCMSILIGAILYNKNIPFNFRVTKYSEFSDFSHVYVIVPKEPAVAFRFNERSGAYYVVDTVIKEFNKEKPFVECKDFQVSTGVSGFLDGIPIQMLNGSTSWMSGIEAAGGFYGLYGDVWAVTMGTDLTGFGLGSIENDEIGMYNHLVRTRDVILAAPQMFKIMKNPLEVARMIDYAIRYWDTEYIDIALDTVEREEQRLLREGVIAYPRADLSGDEFAELSGLGYLGFIKKALKKAGGAVKKAATAVGKGVATAAKATGKAVATAAKATGKAVATAAKKTGKALATAAKKTGGFIARFNPVSLTARAGFLIAIRNNFKKLADKLQYGLYTEAQAQAAGFNMDDFRANQEAYNKAKNTFVNKLKGKESKFNEAIQKGIKNKAINGLGELGWVVAVVSAAASVISSILDFFSGKRNPKTGEPHGDNTITEGEVDDMLNNQGSYADGDYWLNDSNDDGGNLWQNISTTAKDVWNNAIAPSFLPQQQPQTSAQQYYDDEEYEYQNQYNMATQSASSPTPSGVNVNLMPGGAMANIGEFVKKNAVMIGVGTLAVGAGIYFLTRKKKAARGKGLSGARRAVRTVRSVRTSKPKRLTAKKLT